MLEQAISAIFMGFLDNVVGDVKSNLEWKARNKVTEGVSKKVDSVASGKPEAGKCPKCGKGLPANDNPKFCPSCGTKLRTACSACGREYPIGTKFCGDCGKPLG